MASRNRKYAREAAVSATSLKDHYPGMPVTVFTDCPELFQPRQRVFDEIIIISRTRGYRSHWGAAVLDKLKCLGLTPYEVTLYLDTDTRVVSDEIRLLVETLGDDDIAMAECLPSQSRSRRLTRKRQFNSGVIIYRNTARLNQLLVEWERLTVEHFQAANLDLVPALDVVSHIDDMEVRRELLFTNQVSLLKILSPVTNKLGIAVKILPPSWNWRDSEQGCENIVIDHTLKNKIDPDE